MLFVREDVLVLKLLYLTLDVYLFWILFPDRMREYTIVASILSKVDSSRWSAS